MNKIEKWENAGFFINACCNQHDSERCCYVTGVFPTGVVQYEAESKAELVDHLKEDGWEICDNGGMGGTWKLSDLRIGKELYLTCPACNPHFDDPVFWETEKGKN
jgi:hypothetical protein